MGAKRLPTRSIVYWECQSPEHQVLRSRHGTGGLTIHDGAWAYCDGAGSDDAHRWAATGGQPLESLVRWTAPNGATADTYPPTNGDRPTTHFTAKPTNGNLEKNARKVTGVRRI